MEFLLFLLILPLLCGARRVGGGQKFVPNAPPLRTMKSIPKPPPRGIKIMSEEKTTTVTEKTETVAAPVTTDATQAKDAVQATETTTVTEEK